MDCEFATVDVGGLPFAACDLQSAVSWTLDASLRPDLSGLPVRLSNAYCVAVADGNAEYRQLFHTSGVTFPDGAPVVAAMRFFARGDESVTPGRVRGPSFFEAAMSVSEGTEVRHFFLGSTEEVLEAMTRLFRGKFPGLQIAGTWSPPFGPVDERFIEEAAARIRSSDPHVVWVSLGTPKQDFAASAIAERSGRVVVAVGAAFDFSAGLKRVAPAILQRVGLEWAFRLATEPRRLWKRYVFGNVRFLIAVARRRLSKSRETSMGAR